MMRTDTTALIYIRISKEEMARDGLSIPAQLDSCRRYAVDHGWTLGQHFEDHMTGRRSDRPGYVALLEEARRLHRLKRRAVVVVARLDRLGRKLKEQIAFREAMVEIQTPLHIVKEGGEINSLVANVMGSVAEFESQRISDRVRDVRGYVTSSGWWPVGRVGWGWRLRDATTEERALGAPQRVLMEDPAAGPAVHELFRRVADGLSIRKAATWARGLDPVQRGEYVDEDGVLHPARLLSFSRLRFLLPSPHYVGRAPGPDDETPEDVLARPVGRWPALVDDETWLRVQERLRDHARQPRQASGHHLLTGVLQCPRCHERGVQQRMYGALYRFGNGRTRYQCSNANAGGCGLAVVGSTLDASALAQIGVLVETFTSTDPARQAAVRAAWDQIRQPDDAADLQRRRDIWAAERRLTDAQRRLQQAQLRLLDGTLSAGEYPALRDGLQAALDGAEAELARLRAVKPDPILPPLDQVVQAAGSWVEIVAGTDVVAQRALVADLVQRVLPVKVAYGVSRAEIIWTPLGRALQELRQKTAA